MQAKLGQDNLLKNNMTCRPDTGLEIRTLAVWGRARYLTITEDSHNIESW